ncbi:MAG: hypothetical protein WB698_09580 [Solirubrobacteraceae bacterium]|jgi:hypothetical protein
MVGAAVCTIALMVLVGPTLAGAQPATKSCGAAPSYISDLSESGSNCSKARTVAKHAVHKSVYVWTYKGFHCHGEGTNYGGPPVDYTCKKGSARIYFTDTKGASSI